MSNILGLDLGTNSIGWSIREIDREERKWYFETFLQDFIVEFDKDNEIVDAGVIIFKKGVGEGKSGEYSLAAERRTNRSKRRLYNAKRYRKWATLKVLSQNGMCPISEEELRLWSIGNWQDGKNKGRIYPTSPDFIAWLAMDFDKIGEGLNNEKLKPAYKNTYELRADLLKNYKANDKARLYNIGRAFYHLVQRRGFKTSRKNGKSNFGDNELFKKFKEAYPDKINWKPSQIYLYLQSGKDANPELRKERIRNNAVIQRDLNVAEFEAICKTQNLSDELTKKIYQAIYFVRPLRTQKGLVGKCTLEKGKTRIPISHPAFEEFRALSFINNLQWKELNSKKSFEPIPMSLKKQILEHLFFRRLEKGKSKGKFDESGTLDFNDIISRFTENNKWEFNFRNKPNISTCPVISGLMNVFDKEWENKFIEDEKKFGINWHGLLLIYNTKFNNETIKETKLNYEGIWHLLFDYLQTKDDEEGLSDFCRTVLEWDNDKTTSFIEIGISQGYGSLSKNAINKILPFLQQGFIYSEAVSFANLSNVLGKEKFEEKKDEITSTISDTIRNIDATKEKLNIVNGLVQLYFADATTNRAKGFNGTEEEINTYTKEIVNKLINYFGETNWSNKNEHEKKEYQDFVTDKYLTFLSGKQLKEEKASANLNKNPEIDYYKLPRVDEAIKYILRNNFGATTDGVKKLYHPSDIDIYPKAKGRFLEDPNPPSKGWKNPMAMRTMYELRKLINYLLEIGKITAETRIVIEMARELTTTNQRKAIEDWNKDREDENKQYANAIAEIYEIKDPSNDDYNKFRSAIEQITSFEFQENKEAIFKKKYEEFVTTFFKNGNTKSDENVEATDEEVEEINSYDYLMYLILTRDKFSQMLNSKIPNSQKFVRQIIKTSKDYKNKRNDLKEMLIKYRLWKQQKFQCLYTGNLIPLNDLFSSSYQLEHTIPRSISFDSELKNLTVCDASYNNHEKNNKFPTECKNYYKEEICHTILGTKVCSPIKARVDRLVEPKVLELKSRIKNLTKISKKIKEWEVDKKNANIRLRHYLQFELEYWEKKLLTFIVQKRDWKDKWKNSQLIDTQIITKYTRAYLKTLFNKVDVQKGSITAEFRNIYGIMGDEKKDRSKHSHHAKDAAVLTLIPGSAKREEILRQYYLAKEQKKKFQVLPYQDFKISHILKIEDDVLINHVTKDQTLTHTKKIVRKRGRIYKFKNKDGEFMERVMKGDSIRGQLHKETFLGAIKVPERNNKGYSIKENGKYLLKQDGTEDEIWIVKRELIADIDINQDIIVDELLRQHIKKQLENGKRLNEIVDFNNKIIRHIRCRVKAGKGVFSKEKALPIKKHIFKSKHKHKQEYLTQNEENYLYLLYEGIDDKNKIIRAYKILNLFDVSQLRISKIDELKSEPEFQKIIKGKGKNEKELSLKAILKAGDKVIFYKNNKEEITNENAEKRLFKIFKFNELGVNIAYVYLINPLEANPETKARKGDKEFLPDKYQSRLDFTCDKMNCLFEGKDFEIKPDGRINWKL